MDDLDGVEIEDIDEGTTQDGPKTKRKTKNSFKETLEQQFGSNFKMSEEFEQQARMSGFGDEFGAPPGDDD